MTDDPLKTPLHDWHVANGAKMVPFAGYAMPVQYADGIMKEHLHTREAVGLFDVSHMGQVRVTAPGGWKEVATAMERLVPQDVLDLKDGRQRYGLFTNDEGGILDDLMFARQGDALMAVVNAACKHDDIARMIKGLPECNVEPLEDRALFALQGPGSERALSTMAPVVHDMTFMDARGANLGGADAFITRSGYSGEDGFEISVPEHAAVALWERLLAHEHVHPTGLGARDSLRLEAGLCLYGHDIDGTTNPVEAGLKWSIQRVRRNGGAREGGFPGSEPILDAYNYPPERSRVGLRPQNGVPMREGTVLFASDADDDHDEIGRITSGGFGPSVGEPISMGYVTATHNGIGATIYAAVRGKRLPAKVVELPFVTPNYKRKGESP